MHRWLLALVFLQFSPLPVQASSLHVDRLDCTQSVEKINGFHICHVYLKGTVAERDALYVPEIADADRAYIGEQNIGVTGFFLDHIFYARFIPRIYPLKSFLGLKDPVIRFEITSLTGDTAGIGSLKSITFIDTANSFKIVVHRLAEKILIMLLIATLFPVAFMATKMHKRQSISARVIYSGLFGGTVLISLSMAKIPRAVIPWLLSPAQFEVFHAIAHSATLLFLSWFASFDLIGDPRRLREGRLLWRSRIFFAVPLAGFALQVILLFFNGQIGFKTLHATGTGVQIATFFMLTWYRFFREKTWTGFGNILISDLIFISITMASSVIMLADAVYYYFWHSPNVHYWFFYCFIAVIWVDFAQGFERLRIEQRAVSLESDVRAQIQRLTHGKEMLRAVCGVLLGKEIAKLSRISVTSIIDDEVRVLVSAGEAALNENTPVKAVTPLVRHVMQTKTCLVFSGESQFRNELGLTEYHHPTVLAPVIQEDRVIGLLSLMGRRDARFSRSSFLFLEMAMRHLTNEVLTAISKMILEEKTQHLEAITCATSGLVWEMFDQWGRMRKDVPLIRRVVISIDGIKSTDIDQLAVSSPRVWDLYGEYKEELYAHWMAFKEVFELVSTDVRGDDFWTLTPREFHNPYLRSLGSGKVALIAAYLMEEKGREICARPEFQILNRSGNHCAVSADEIEIKSLGTTNSVVHDTHCKNMSRLQRIRSEALPGSVLVDLMGSELSEAISDITLFKVKNVESLARKIGAFKDIQSFPRIVALVGIHETDEIMRLKARALKIAAESPYRIGRLNAV